MNDRSAASESVERLPDAIATRRSGRGLELLIALGVLAISLVSLFVAVSANRTQERMLAASVWPTLQFGTSNVAPDGTPQITFDLLNRGVGPARLRWSELTYDGTPQRTLGGFLAQCCAVADAEGRVGYSSGLRRRVLGAGEWIQVVRIPREGVPEALWQALDAARHAVRLRACYCSVLDDCWILDSRADEPTPVEHCPAAPAQGWGG